MSRAPKYKKRRRKALTQFGKSVIWDTCRGSGFEVIWDFETTHYHIEY